MNRYSQIVAVVTVGLIILLIIGCSYKIKSINPFDMFDHIYYINLDKRKDKKKDILTELKKIGIKPNSDKVTRISGVIDKFGALGCSKAHLNALLDCQKKGYKNCLIFEDDFLFKLKKNKIHNMLTEFNNLQVPWDILMFSGNIIKSKPTNNKILRKVINAQTTSGYAVNGHFLPTLIQNYQLGINELSKYSSSKHDFCIDIYWKKLQPYSNWYVFNPKLGYQRDGYSDIENRKVNYRV